ncbi:MAG: ABC transporter permease, partial [Erysipelotrichaceae bacterium]|nr:ABC transporter permease [Erysipelotrichaceae bacterium]
MIESFVQILTNPNFYANVVAVTPPILLAALGCAIAEKSNSTNMGMEGIMLISSLTGVLASY